MVVVTCTLNGHLLVVGVFDSFPEAIAGSERFATEILGARNFQYHTGYTMNEMHI